ncbi:hypothetical protein LOTGIDRAFT_177864 [Lottia gigantea]|uniref:BTB domain-containing protein n=1 Tax=Lottia gigantea TaxID=225164 RepID=V4B634_LOTGI|nr:hypothetical protein LOTGIDRAFT_177864 [Lottia gigantea]ESP02986.1 hypothetical protein LOTGIDRAFT_177864 [Lottia gigantea]
MADDVVVFKREDLPSTAFPVIADIRRQGKLCDVGDQRFSAHRIILAASIPYFNAMFTHDMVESKQGEICMQGIDPSALESLVNFAYDGRLQIDAGSVQSLLIAASFLHLQCVKEACCDFLQNRLHPQNCLGVRSFADQYMCTSLVEAANKFIQNNFKQVSVTDEFMSLSKAEFVDILSRDELNVSNEEQVFEAALSWVKKDLDNRKDISLKFYKKYFVIENYLLDEARDYHLMPERRPLLQTFKTKPRCCTDVPGMIYAVGGLTSSGESLSTVERYDPIVDRWKIAEAMSTMRSRVGVAVLEGKLYAIGGNDGAERLNTVEVFEPEKKQWKKVAPMNCKRSAQGAAALNGQLYVCGGYDGVSSLKSVEIYDPKTDVWAMITDMQKLRSAAGVAVLQGEIYACGGHDGLSIYDSVELYNTALGSWQSVAPMQSKRCRLGVAALNGKLYAAGGYDGSVFLRTVECYDPAENKWKFVASMARKRSRVSLVATYGRLYAIGGYDGITNLNSVEYYDPSTDTWKFAKIMSAHEGGVGVGVIPIEESV